MPTRAKDTPNVSLAEAAESYGAHVIPLVEDIGLDVLWLGLRVRGTGKARGATRTSSVQLAATKIDGPGKLIAYLTESLGQPDLYFDSGEARPTVRRSHRPPTPISTGRSPNPASITSRSKANSTTATAVQPLGKGTFTFAVGVEPHQVNPADGGTATVLDDGHTDLTVDLDTGQVYAYSDAKRVGAAQSVVPAGRVVIDVPGKALETVPDDPRFSFLGTPGTQIHQFRRRCSASTCTARSTRICGRTSRMRRPTCSSCATR